MKSWMKLTAALLLAVMANAPMYATCGPSNCSGSLCLAELIYDEYFNDNCAWVFTGNSSRELVNGAWAAQLDGLGSVYQDIVVPGGYDDRTMTVTVWINIANPSNGTERMTITVYDANGLAHAVDTIYPSDTPGRYPYTIDNYSLPSGDQTIQLRFQYINGSNPQGTTFYVESAHMWLMNY